MIPKTICFITAILIINIATGQLVFDQYRSYMDVNNDFDMSYNVKEKRIYINAYSNNTAIPAGITNSVKDLTEFYESFKKARDKYIEWKKIAEAQDVSSLEKDLPFSYKTTVYFTLNGKVNTCKILCKYRFFVVTNNGTKVYMLMFNSGEIKHYQFIDKNGKVSDEWIPSNSSKFDAFNSALRMATNQSQVIEKFDGIAIAFNDETEIDAFLAKITPEKLKEVEKEKGKMDEQQRVKKEKLFN
ncbi:MAG: hypothetical protein ACK5NK_05910 [Niabella sp.]